MLVSVESTDKFDSNTLAVDVSEEEFRTLEASHVPSTAQKNGTRPIEQRSAHARTEGIRSMALNREEVRSEEHVIKAKRTQHSYATSVNEIEPKTRSNPTTS